MNAITLRNGRQLEDPIAKTKTNKGGEESESPQVEKTGVEGEEPSVPPPSKPKVPFPQRFTNSKLEAQFKKFVDMLKKIYINIPFTEALSQMPSYAKI